VPIKGNTLLLGASLTVNAALVAVVAVKAPSWFGASAPETDQGVRRSASSDGSPEIPSAHTPSGPALEALLSGDLKTLPDRLRAAGLSPSLARALIQAQLNEIFNARRRDLIAHAKVNPYWSQGFKALDKDTMTKFIAMNKERMDLQKELLPDDPNPPFLARQQEMYGGLSPEKTKQVQSINSDYQDLKNQIYNSANGALLPEDMQKLALLDKEQQSDMAAALSPDELLEYQLRNSDTADQMRNSMQAFNPTEDEYRAIFKVQQAFDQQYGANVGAMTAEQREAREAHKGELMDQLQGILTPDRFAEYKQETDPNFLSVNQTLSRFDLPKTATKQVMDIQSDITKRADAIRQDTSITDADRATRLSALADEAASKATAVVGERGFEAYKQTNGSWLTSLKPPAN
jgi:hypothetical protein